MITQATLAGGPLINLRYTKAIDADQLDPAAFVTTPSGSAGEAAINIGSHEVQLSMDDTVDTETSITYSGSTPGILTPQTISFT